MAPSLEAQALQDQQDDAEIARLLNNEPSAQASDALDFLARDLDVGEKAADAEDFEDIGDDDLASEGDDDHGINGSKAARYPDDNTGRSGVTQSAADQEFGDDLFGDEDNAFVFGDGPMVQLHSASDPDKSSTDPVKPTIVLPGVSGRLPRDDEHIFNSPASYGASPMDQDLAQEFSASATPEAGMDADDDDDEMDEALALQRALFAKAGQRGSQEPPDAPETNLELFFSIWPSYDPNRTARFTELFPPPHGAFNWKTPLKPPKALQLTKVSLEIAQDSEKTFRSTAAAAAAQGKAARRVDAEDTNVILATRPQIDDADGDDNGSVDDGDETGSIAGLQWDDIELACCDWDDSSVSSAGSLKRKISPLADSGVDMDYDLDDEHSDRPGKRTKTTNDAGIRAPAIVPIIPSLDDPESTTERLAGRVALDMYDPDLLIDESIRATHAKRRRYGINKGEARDAASHLTRRYNISNDDAYELLKENHQHKVRSTLGSLSIEHSMPAAKLQYPYYRVKLEPRQLRSFHRPPLAGLKSGKEVRFSKPKNIKRKHLRGRETQDIFNKSEDLSMGDNSSGLLLEYSEEAPMMLSNFGMGNRLVNYYRRKDDNDSSRPKEDIGETQVLLPQDRSPFANFGHVDPGELVPAVQNGLYRAPIFKHDSRPTDFLVVSSTTGEGGTKLYLRNTENLHVVGQQFPSVEIPGEHSRKVTDAAKRRLKAVSYRVWRKYSQRRGPPLTNATVLKHLPGSDIAQNRGKMREFMKYDKNHSIWIPKDGDIVPDADELRKLIRPEDICLLDSMQVGVQHLNDLGLRRDDDRNEDDDEQEGENIEILLAPWSTTKNFINACQGKAMLKLHGEGDPTGRGEGYSFIKTSMKGGFRALGESIEERLDARKLKENHGHSYNVAKQQRAYDESIRRIWRAQHESLTSKAQHSDTEIDIDDDPENYTSQAGTPRIGTPATFSRREDESVSQFSRGSNRNNQTLVITRLQRNTFGQVEEVPVTITNPRVISAYKKAKIKEQAARIDPTNIQMTGDKEYDELQIKAAEEEIARLNRNVDRRHARERAKGIVGSPSLADSPGADDEPMEGGTPHGAGPGTGKRGGRKKVNPEGTGRRCANCGQIGHIKTNKKLCPMLNGTMKPEDAHTGFGGGGNNAAGSGPADNESQNNPGGDEPSSALPSGGADGMFLPKMEI